MLITQKAQLKQYDSAHRIWQGIPGIEVTRNGRHYVSFYSGGVREGCGNYALLLTSEDGENFGEAVAVAVPPTGGRCYDPGLWIDPLGRLWFWWCVAPHNAVRAAVCEDPDAEELCFSEPFTIANDVMMNKPTVLSTGEWLFCAAVWAEGLPLPEYPPEQTERLAFVYRTADHGRSFARLGGVAVPKRSFDEHMVVERRDGTLAMYVRTTYGIAVATSIDGGLHWTGGEDSGLGGPCSRFHICRLSSGRLLLINHVDFKGRNNLTALLSEDDGRTWPYRMLLDGRNEVSYPDATERNGMIYVTYDRERGCFKKSLREAYASAREILVSRFTEQDVIAGAVKDPRSRLGVIVSKLGRYCAEDENPYGEVGFHDSETVARSLVSATPRDELLQRIFECYSVNCMNLHRIDSDALDALVASLDGGADPVATVAEIIRLVRRAGDTERCASPIIEAVRAYVTAHVEEELSVGQIAQAVCISRYYLCHLFKKETGTTVGDYVRESRLSSAKRLLRESTYAVTEIAQKCGFSDASHLAKLLSASVGMTPTAYRRLHRKDQ